MTTTLNGNPDLKRARISSHDKDERKRLSALGYFIESGDGQYLVMRLDRPVHLPGRGKDAEITRGPIT